MRNLKLILSAAATLGAFGTNGASAADLAARPYTKAPPPAAVWSNDIVASNNQLSIFYVGTNVNYTEYSPGFAPFGPAGTPIDSEKGWLNGVGGAASLMTNFAGIENLYLRGEVTYVQGNTNYWAGGGAVTSASDPQKIWNEDFRIGKGFAVSNTSMLTPYIGAGAQQWDRSLTPGPNGSLEAYTHGYAGGGLLFQVNPARGLVLSAYGFGGGTFSAQMANSFNGGAAIVPFTYTGMGGKAIYMAGASLDYAITRNFHANVGFDYVNFRYLQSNPNAVGGVEPNSLSEYWKVKAGVGYAFDWGMPVVAKY
jgi:hypothetical protein